jgi:hypothetical protein
MVKALVLKYKEDLNTIFQVLLYLVIGFTFSSFDNSVAEFIIIGSFIFLTLYGIYQNLLYKKGAAGYLLIPTQNDTYSKTTSVLFGAFIIVMSVLGFINKWGITGSSLGLIAGILLLISGVLAVPNGKVQFKNGLIYFYNLPEPISEHQLSSIEVSDDRLLLHKTDGRRVRIGNFKLDSNDRYLFETYVNAHKTNQQLIVKQFEIPASSGIS